MAVGTDRDKAPAFGEPADPRLIEVVAAALCWAEFTASGHARRSDEPMIYWAKMSEHPKIGYRKSAEVLARFMRGDSNLAIVPKEATDRMLNVAENNLGRHYRADTLRQMWSCMLVDAWLTLGAVVRGVSDGAAP